MRNAKFLLPALVILGLFFSLAWADHPMERGRIIFEDPNFAAGVIACNSCHPNGSGLEKASGKTEFKVRDRTFGTLEEVVNYWIEYGTLGRPIGVDSYHMQDLVAYIESLAKGWERDESHVQ